MTKPTETHKELFFKGKSAGHTYFEMHQELASANELTFEQELQHAACANQPSGCEPMALTAFMEGFRIGMQLSVYAYRANKHRSAAKCTK